MGCAGGQLKDDSEQRFRAACALAGFDGAEDDPAPGRWQKASKFVAGQLLAAVQHNPSHYPPLLEMLRPVRHTLLAPLAEVFRQRQRPDSERSFATTILADYAADQPLLLADLLMDADDKQFAVLYPKLKEQGQRGLPVLTREIDQQAAPRCQGRCQGEAGQAAGECRGGPTADGAASEGLAALETQFRSEGYGAISFIVSVRWVRMPRRSSRGWHEEPDVTIRRALLASSLGEFDEQELARLMPGKRLLPKLQEHVPHSGRSGAARSGGMVTRNWQQETGCGRSNDAWAQGPEQRAEAAATASSSESTEDEGPDAAAVVRQQSRSDDGGDPWPGGVRDGIAVHGRGAGPR